MTKMQKALKKRNRKLIFQKGKRASGSLPSSLRADLMMQENTVEAVKKEKAMLKRKVSLVAIFKSPWTLLSMES